MLIKKAKRAGWKKRWHANGHNDYQFHLIRLIQLYWTGYESIWWDNTVQNLSLCCRFQQLIVESLKWFDFFVDNSDGIISGLDNLAHLFHHCDSHLLRPVQVHLQSRSSAWTLATFVVYLKNSMVYTFWRMCANLDEVTNQYSEIFLESGTTYH